MTIDPRSARALKEWGAIEQLLAAGRSILLLRKGGLWERREGFEMEHRQFWIFPTLYHQNPLELKAEHDSALQSARTAQPAADHVRLEHFALVTDAFRVESLDTLRAIERHQALTAETIENRFHYRGRPYLHALLLRVFRIPTPHIIPNTLGYEGCVSWVELDEALPTAGAEPVLAESEYQASRDALCGALVGSDGVVAV